MKLAIIALAAAAFAGAASAANEVTDVDYLKANRCKGLATSIDGVVDVAALNSFIKAEGVSRAPYIVSRGDEVFQRARREAKSPDRRERLTHELATYCQAYLGSADSVSRHTADSVSKR